MRRAVIVVGCAVGGCWASAPPPSSPVVQNTTSADTPSSAPRLPSRSVWTGRYECAQGVTAVELTLDIDSGGAAIAVFEFGPLADNPTVPAGAYRMRGVVTQQRDRIAVVLDPDRWIEQPDGYMMVGLRATIDRDRRKIEGHIENASCDWFDAQRSE